MDDVDIFDGLPPILGGVGKLDIGITQIVIQAGRPKKNNACANKNIRSKVVKHASIPNAQGAINIVSTQQKVVKVCSLLVVVWTYCIRCTIKYVD
jgi:hypothetical protein